MNSYPPLPALPGVPQNDIDAGDEAQGPPESSAQPARAFGTSVGAMFAAIKAKAGGMSVSPSNEALAAELVKRFFTKLVGNKGEL